MIQFVKKHKVTFGLLALSLISFLTILMVTGEKAAAQELSLNLGEEGSLSGRVVQLLMLMTVLSLAPAIVIVMTSFTRIAIVFSLLRSAMGTQQTPPNVVLISLALFLTSFIMAPTLKQAYDTGVAPLVAEEITEEVAFENITAPFHAFMMKHVREKDLLLFLDLSKLPAPATKPDTPFQVLVPAFIISELRRAFEIGFLLFVPFIIIDLIVASILMSMGMMMLPPVMISLPFKLIFFVLVDGWHLVAGSLVQSFT
ncbi:flagellar type III secretion system pore protein FliP [Paremcibacter congregatus]|uniref:Flagellar biosynthetic protein FliP n=1 Tax=Paremcibacter congregatus TaxID=2043170 RepID=A0A2G4YM06_9PROT|nr:flagellar type III secretion system pore protein FliP [Paremcibacter congregatus]PHZ83359.1 flagellar biosynthetic protein FliP [Paremcibacter congregatus]QDE28170.1 flagellar type III secretion system pore protein FliP [Paremcibacter congregatus]|tara:strand:+ start:7379 stop:8146 length:768 start_codon:yes stop_codon:yes gene_type:complete